VSATVGKSKNRRKTAEHLKNFPQLLQLLINVNIDAGKVTEIAVFAYSHWAILPSLLVADRCYLGISRNFPTPFKNCPEIFNSLRALPMPF
jgi:hypothetical protein